MARPNGQKHDCAKGMDILGPMEFRGGTNFRMFPQGFRSSFALLPFATLPRYRRFSAKASTIFSARIALIAFFQSYVS
jgi:hypothetical protein